ncbi:MAG: ZIP family metal transporter [Clostridia bacterium]|nr:ZIP family metal transporter [Clostridia bacterium]
MVWKTILGLSIPFLGTTLGAACVFFLKKNLGERLSRALCGFAAGVMLASSVWSLLIPAIEQSEGYGNFSFLPAAIGFFFGVFFLFGLDRLAPGLIAKANAYTRDTTGKLAMTVLAVTLHNIPEGMAVGAIYAGALVGGDESAMGAAFALALGIAIQNFPEGAIISLPLSAGGSGKGRAFFLGTLSGAVEPVFSLVTLLAFGRFAPAMPYLLAFAAGAMIYVVVEELIPEMSVERRRDGLFCFSLGFAIMMILDVALG